MRKLLLFTPLLLLFMIASASAQPTLPTGTVAYVNLTLNESWSSVVSPYVQQNITINQSNYTSYINYNGSIANFEITYANGTVVPSWIESNQSNQTLVWLNITNTTTNVYLDFFNMTTNMLNSTGTNGIGEAPQLSSTYAEYDDGASVFTNYWNFAGTTLPSGWTASGVSYTVNNGVSVGATTEGTKGTLLTTNAIFNASEVLDIYGTQNYDTSYYQGMGALYITSSVNSGTFFYTSSSSSINTQQTTSSGSTAFDNTQVGTAPLTAIYTIQATSTTSNYFVNYGSEQTISADAPTYPLQAGILTAITAQDSITWIRTRSYPPNGVMPSVTFGAVQSIYPTLSISPNPATYGQSVTITATCPVSTDTCAIDYPSLGTAIATGTGSATYTYNAFSLGAGTYSSFYANDITQGTNSTPVTLTVNKAPVSPSCSFAGASIANDTTQQTLAAQNYLNCTMPNHNSQLTVNLYYNGSIVTSGSLVSYLTKFDNYNNSFTYNTIGNTNYTAGSFIGHIDYLLYKLISATNLGPTAYETATVNPQYTLNITKAAQNATLTLNVQGINVSSITETIPSGTNLFSPKYAIPLQQVNDTTYTFNAILTARGSFGTITTTVNSLTQHELQNYFPAISIMPSPNIVGDNISINTVINQKTPLDLANVSGNVQLGNKTISEQINSLYNYTARVLSFIPSQYNLTMPKVGTPETYTPKSVVKLSFGNQSVYRNATLSFTDYYPALLECNTTTPTAVDWTFYNASNPTSAITSNVLMKGFFTLINNFFTYQINGTSAGWTATATAPSYKTCIYPSFASFKFNNTISASAANTAVSTAYYQDFPVSNITNTQKLYLLQIPNPIAYEVFVENVSTVTYIPALVKVLLYDANTNSTIQISELKTAQNSGTALTLQNNDTYKLIAYTPNGKTNIGSTNFFTVTGSCSSGVCDEIVPVSTANVTFPQSTLQNIQHSCTVTNNTATNSSSVSCLYSSTTGASYNISLLMNKTGAIFAFTNDNVCTKTIDAASGTLNCVVNQTNATQYTYVLNLRYDNYTYALETGLVGTQQTSYGPNGYFLMALLLATVALAFVTRNANFVVVGFTAGWVAGSLLGLAYAPGFTDGFLIIVAAFILYLINRR